MNKELWTKLNKLRGADFRNLEELAELLQNEEFHLSPSELFVSWPLLAARLGRNGGLFFMPEWLATIFRSLTQGTLARTICDPWAGIGFVIAAIRESTQAQDVLAYTRSDSEVALGKVLIPDVQWQVGDPLSLLALMQSDIDVVASILPMGAKEPNSLIVSTKTGERLELRDDLDRIILVAASMRLSLEGMGLFIVTPSFFFSERSVFHQFSVLGLGLEAAFALPPGTFAPYTSISAYLVIVRKHPAVRMFVGQLSSDTHTNLQVIANFKDNKEGGTLELGRFVEPSSFKGLDSLRLTERLVEAQHQFGAPAVRLGNISTVINMGRFGDTFQFEKQDNAIYIPLIGNSDVVDSLDELKLKRQNYAQIVIDPVQSNARFVAQFLNTELGKELRETSKSGTSIPKLTKLMLKGLPIFVPNLATQQIILELETRITAEQNTLLSLQNEITGFRRELWTDLRSLKKVDQQLRKFSVRLSGSLKQHAAESLIQWYETLPFPLASILRVWQATPSSKVETKYEMLLLFFEAAAEFFGIIFLSAFFSNEAVFEPHKEKLRQSMQHQTLSLQKATFGTWKLILEYLSKQTRVLLSGQAEDRALCANLFADPSLLLAEAMSRKKLIKLFDTTNKMRNDWIGHVGVVGDIEAQFRHEQLLVELQNFREITADIWEEIQMIHASSCRLRRGVFENEVAVLTGSHSEFFHETRQMSFVLDVEQLYLARQNAGAALQLLPLVKVGPLPKSEMNVCYFYNRFEGNDVRYLSYHFKDNPELFAGPSDPAKEIISRLEGI